MSKKEKLKQKFLSVSKNLTFNELKSVMEWYGFSVNNKGKTSGSAVSFIKDDDNSLEIIIHKPHPQKEVKQYAIKKIISFLKANKIVEK